MKKESLLFRGSSGDKCLKKEGWNFLSAPWISSNHDLSSRKSLSPTHFEDHGGMRGWEVRWDSWETLHGPLVAGDIKRQCLINRVTDYQQLSRVGVQQVWWHLFTRGWVSLIGGWLYLFSIFNGWMYISVLGAWECSTLSPKSRYCTS